MSETHKLNGGSRLSQAYTFGRKGLSCPARYGDKTSKAYAAWAQGRKEWQAERKHNIEVLSQGRQS